MAYVVSITQRAQRDLAELYTGINAEHSLAAVKWYERLKKAILSLEERPNRSAIIHKTGNLRELLHGRKPHVYRVIYRVLEESKEVQILHIRHGARRRPKESDLI